MKQDIENLIAVERWAQARRVIRSKLRSKPDDHWLLSRLALTYYEERNYRRALKYDSRALAVAPDCPLALWGYAGALEMLGHEKEAIKVDLVRCGINGIGFGPCGEGLAWARGLIADCHYRLAHCYRSLHRRSQALDAFKTHVSLRVPGCRSIYSLRKVREEIDALQHSRARG